MTGSSRRSPTSFRRGNRASGPSRAPSRPPVRTSPSTCARGSISSSASRRFSVPFRTPRRQRPGRSGRTASSTELGHGGMGVVYLAEQDKPIRRRVALKLIKLGLDTRQVVARFEAERQALALMNHPNIARVFDAGATADGRPYFVMEFVQGVPITTLLRRASACPRASGSSSSSRSATRSSTRTRRASSTATSSRRTCSSRAATAGRAPKVIDFGIAKATHAAPDRARRSSPSIGQIIGTPEYMSPEQAEIGAARTSTRAPTSTRSASCSTSCSPARCRSSSRRSATRGVAEMQRHHPRGGAAAAEHARSRSSATGATRRRRRSGAPTPRALGAQLRGDLDWITMKALEKDRTRRYAVRLGARRRRRAGTSPTSRSTPDRRGVGYRLRKFVRRHRAPLAVSASLAAAAVASLLLYADARHARRDALGAEVDRRRQGPRCGAERAHGRRGDGSERTRRAEREHQNAEEARLERDKNARLADGQILADALAGPRSCGPHCPRRRPRWRTGSGARGSSRRGSSCGAGNSPRSASARCRGTTPRGSATSRRTRGTWTGSTCSPGSPRSGARSRKIARRGGT